MYAHDGHRHSEHYDLAEDDVEEKAEVSENISEAALGDSMGSMHRENEEYHKKDDYWETDDYEEQADYKEEDYHQEQQDYELDQDSDVEVRFDEEIRRATASTLPTDTSCTTPPTFWSSVAQSKIASPSAQIQGTSTKTVEK